MASYEKMVKYMVEKIQQSLAPLEETNKNQEIMIIQNKKIIELLECLAGQRAEDNQRNASSDDSKNQE